MSRARILFIADFKDPWNTDAHLTRDFEAIDCVVRRLRCAEADFAAVKIAVGAWQPDLVLYMKARAGLPGRWTRHEWTMLGVPTASYHLDLYVGLDREHEIGVDPFFLTEHVFTADGDPETQRIMEYAGVNHHWLMPACVSDETHYGAYERDIASDIAFVGSVNYHEQWPWRKEMLDLLALRYGDQFRVWTHQDRMRGGRLNNLMASTKVIVGDSLALPGHINYFSDRYFETIGRGGVLVAPYVEGLPFVPGVHYMPYTAGVAWSMFDQIDYLLDHAAPAAIMRNRGQAFVREHHTYKDRASQLLTEVGL